MKRTASCFALVFLLWAAAACNRGIVPDEALEGLIKPEIASIEPGRVQFNDSGFFLGVGLKTTHPQFVLYLNDRQAGAASPGYGNSRVTFRLAKELIQELLGSSPGGVTLEVRITGIGEQYDISGDFDRYRDYVSEPFPLVVERGTTAFSTVGPLFPEWTDSSQPLIRCDAQGGIYLAWLEALQEIDQAFFSFSADEGRTWSQVLNISRTNAPVYLPDLAVDDSGHFYMTWLSYQGSRAEVYFCRSLDHGATWHLPVRLGEESYFGVAPVLGVDDRGAVFVAWPRSSDAGSAVELVSSQDFGQTWSSRVFPAVPWPMSGWRPLLGIRPGGRMDLFIARWDNGGLLLDIHSSLDYGGSWRKQSVAAGDCHISAENSGVRCGEGVQLFLYWSGVSYAGHYFSLWNYLLARSGSGAWSAIQDLKDGCPSSGSKFSLVSRGARTDAILDHGACLYLLKSLDGGETWAVPETVAGADGEIVTHHPDAVRHPSGKTYLVFVRKDAAGNCSLHLTAFD